MLTIRNEQLRIFDEAANAALCRRLSEVVRIRFTDRVPPSQEELERSVAGWIGDARLWGLTTEARIAPYVLERAKSTGRRDPLEDRLQVYLQMYWPTLVAGVDLPRFASATVHFAQAHQVLAEEGVAWLAVILLSGRAKGAPQVRWIEALLDERKKDGLLRESEEARLHEVHRQAEARGWFVSGRSA